MTDRVAVELTHGERAILARGLIEWGGPATATDEIAHLLGFNSVAPYSSSGSSRSGRMVRAEPTSLDRSSNVLLTITGSDDCDLRSRLQPALPLMPLQAAARLRRGRKPLRRLTLDVLTHELDRRAKRHGLVEHPPPSRPLSLDPP